MKQLEFSYIETVHGDFSIAATTKLYYTLSQIWWIWNGCSLDAQHASAEWGLDEHLAQGLEPNHHFGKAQLILCFGIHFVLATNTSGLDGNAMLPIRRTVYKHQMAKMPYRLGRDRTGLVLNKYQSTGANSPERDS
ncbi:hypothetical protein HZH66_002478 [Vespula vulgaris]|uniref:Uncharacterized protein n=1 Tax=Vespula vulgaris TaxID=7454 RepID=A0A834KPP9_VESVU|nr:hypothetical protein HZH66_002478 [Vespula vulgaris]